MADPIAPNETWAVTRAKLNNLIAQTDAVTDAAVQTAADAVATAADRVQTGLDATATAADRVQTGLDAIATAADRVQTGLDRVATGEDRTAVASDKAQVEAIAQDLGTLAEINTIAAAVEANRQGAEDAEAGAVAAAANAQASARTVATWAILSGLTGSVAGEGAEVLDSDTGTHTDPVVGGTVANAGRYSWSVSPAGWRRIGATGLAGKADRSVTNIRDLFPGRDGSGITAAELTAFNRILKAEFFGVPLNKVLILKFLFWKDVGSRFNATIMVADDTSGTNAVDACSFNLGSGTDVWTGRREITLAAVGGSGITGTLVIDFTDTTAIGLNATPTTAAMFQRRRISADASQAGAARDAALSATINAAIGTTLALSADSKLPFADSVTATPIRSLVRDVRLYNADPTHQYVFSVLTVETFAIPLTRFRATIRDITAGVDVCTVARSVSSQPGWASFVATLSSPVKLTSSGLSPASTTGIYAVVELDWSAVSNFFSFGSNTYTLAGISPERVYTDDDISDYLDSDHVHEVITVGASGADFTTLRAAVESTYSWVTGASPVLSAPICDRACYHHRVLIRLIDDATYNATFLLIPEWVEIQGNGYERTFIERENTNPDAMLEMHLSGKLRDLTIISATNPEYAIHSDDFNRNANGGAAQNRFIRQSFKRIRMRGAAGHTGFLFGGGLSAGQHILMDDVIGEHADATTTTAAFFWHNTGPTLSTPALNVGVRPSLIEMRGCSSPNYNGIYLQTLHAAGISVLSLTDCEFNRIQHEIPAGEVSGSGRARIQWEITGRYPGAWINSDGNADSFTLEWAPVAAPRRRARNSTGTAIPKGRFVRFAGTGTIALCGANERPEAWTIAEIANGADGDVILTRRIDDAYIDVAETGSGEWGITTAGTLDYAAATKLGRTVGGIVEVYS